MEIGQVGIITEDFFKNKEDKWKYLATAVDVTEYWQQQHPNKDLKKSYYELRYLMIQNKDDFNCMVLYLGNVVVPDIIFASGTNHRMETNNTKFWKYHKVLLTIDGINEVRFLHEKCLPFFTWHRKE